jgi:hypothetical protein
MAPASSCRAYLLSACRSGAAWAWQGNAGRSGAFLPRCPAAQSHSSTAPTERVLLSQANDIDDAHVHRVDQHDLILKDRVF